MAAGRWRPGRTTASVPPPSTPGGDQGEGRCRLPTADCRPLQKKNARGDGDEGGRLRGCRWRSIRSVAQRTPPTQAPSPATIRATAAAPPPGAGGGTTSRLFAGRANKLSRVRRGARGRAGGSAGSSCRSVTRGTRVRRVLPLPEAHRAGHQAADGAGDIGRGARAEDVSVPEGASAARTRRGVKWQSLPLRTIPRCAAARRLPAAGPVENQKGVPWVTVANPAVRPRSRGTWPANARAVRNRGHAKRCRPSHRQSDRRMQMPGPATARGGNTTSRAAERSVRLANRCHAGGRSAAGLCRTLHLTRLLPCRRRRSSRNRPGIGKSLQRTSAGPDEHPGGDAIITPRACAGQAKSAAARRPTPCTKSKMQKPPGRPPAGTLAK